VRHETLDDTIDRVAGDMTAVSADPAFADRVRRQLADRHRPRWMRVLVPAAVVSAMAVVSVLWLQHETPAPANRELAANALGPVAPLHTAVSGDAPARAEGEAGTLVTRRAERASRAAADAERSGPDSGAGTSVVLGVNANPAAADAGVASPGPPPLVIAALMIVPVVRPDAVAIAIAPLEIAPLEVPGLQVGEEPKEQR
jgi:hypothetical protein